MKWKSYEGKDILPFSIADMDFQSLNEVIEALKIRVSQGIFGYTSPSLQLIDVVKQWLYSTYNWKIKNEWIVWVPGVVSGLHIAVRAICQKDSSALTFTPAYPPFLSAPERFKKKLIKVALVERNNRWEINFSALEKSIETNTKLLLLCNPHNPTGRIFTQDELKKVLALCRKHNIIICSDEVHCELLLDRNRKHTPIATLSKDALFRSITFMSASKTYNLAGLSCGFAIIPNQEIRKEFEQARAGIASLINLSGYTATQAAFQYGSPWKKQLLKYLNGNKKILQTFLKKVSLPIPQIEATYLAWIDVKGLKLEHPTKFFEQAGIALSDGEEFGMHGFVRLNFACPRSQLVKGLQKMRLAIEDINK